MDSVDQLHLSIGDCWFIEADFAVVIKVAVDGAGDCHFEVERILLNRSQIRIAFNDVGQRRPLQAR